MASKRKSTTPCMIPLKSMHLQEEEEVEPEGDPPDCLLHSRRDSSTLSGKETCEQDAQEVVDTSRPDGCYALQDLGTYICRPCGFESKDLNLFLDHVYSGHPDFRAEPSFYCMDCGVSTAKFEGLALHNARAHPSTAATTLQVRRRDRRITVEQSLVVGEVSNESEISITKTPIMKMLKGKSEPKRIVVSQPTLDSATNREIEKKDMPTVTHVPTIVHNGAPGKVSVPSAIQIVNSSGTLPVLKTAITQVVSMVQNRMLHQQAPITASTSTSPSNSRNLPKVMIPLSSIPTYNAAMDTNSFLKTSFSKFPYPTKAELCYLTVVTKYPEEQIKIWFTAQRLKQGISWSPEEIEDARRKMFNTIIQTAPPTPQQQRHSHHNTQHTITVLPASLGPSGIPHILQGSLVGQGGVIVTQPVMANGLQVSSAPVALAVTPKPQAAAKPLMQARPAAALVADKGASMVVSTVGSSSSGSPIITSSYASSVISSNCITRNTSVISISGSSNNYCNKSKSDSSGNDNSSTSSTSNNSSSDSNSTCSNSISTSSISTNSISTSSISTSSNKVTDLQPPAISISHSSRTLPNSFLDPSFYKNKKSQEQLSALKQSFIRCQFPGQEEVERLTKITGLTVREVRKWFSDRRYHYRNLKGSRSSVGGLFSGNSLLDLADSPSSSESPKPNQAAQSPPRQQQQQMSPPTPSRRAPRQQTPDFTAIRYKERDPQQLRALEASFVQDPSPSEDEVGRLRAETKMTRREIDGWFSDRRKKAAAEKKKEEAEKAEDLIEKDAEAKCRVEDPSQTSQDVKEEKHNDEASCSTPKVNPIKINLKMLKVTESNGKTESESPQSAQVEGSITPPPSTSSSSSQGKNSADPFHLLKQFFVRARWPTSAQHDDLAAKTGLPRAEVVRWFGDARYGHKNGQLKWLESYQQMGGQEREDHRKDETKVLKAHLSLHGKLEEEHMKGLVESSGLSEELIRRWFATQVPSLLESEAAATAEPVPQDQRFVNEQKNDRTADAKVLNNDSTLAHSSQSVNPKQGTD